MHKLSKEQMTNMTYNKEIKSSGIEILQSVSGPSFLLFLLFYMMTLHFESASPTREGRDYYKRFCSWDVPSNQF